MFAFEARNGGGIRESVETGTWGIETPSEDEKKGNRPPAPPLRILIHSNEATTDGEKTAFPYGWFPDRGIEDETKRGPLQDQSTLYVLVHSDLWGRRKRIQYDEKTITQREERNGGTCIGGNSLCETFLPLQEELRRG